MKKRIKRRILSVVLSAAMLLTSTPVYADVMAEPIDPEVGLCEHHTEHEDWCGYIAPTLGTPCGHEHDEACYSEVLACGLEEDVTATDGNSAHIHDDECYELEVDCHHEHDDECGYVEASVGAECEFTCAECIALEELGGEGEGVSPWVINDRFQVGNLWYKELDPYTAQVYAVEGGGTVAVPKTVTNAEGEKFDVVSIYGGAFEGNEEITSVNIEITIVGIEVEMFKGCTNLETVVLPNSVHVIGESAFEGCESLTSIKLLNKVIEIEDYAFAGCTSLTSVDLSMIKTIGDYAFYECESLSSVVLGDSLEQIGDYAFYNCHGFLKAYNEHCAEKEHPYSFEDRINYSVDEPYSEEECCVSAPYRLYLNNNVSIGEMALYLEASEHNDEAALIFVEIKESEELDDVLDQLSDSIDEDIPFLVVNIAYVEAGNRLAVWSYFAEEDEIIAGTTEYDLVYEGEGWLGYFSIEKSYVSVPDQFGALTLNYIEYVDNGESGEGESGDNNILRIPGIIGTPSNALPQEWYYVTGINDGFYDNSVSGWCWDAISFPKTIQYIGEGAFADCLELEMVSFRDQHDLVEELASILVNCGVEHPYDYIYDEWQYEFTPSSVEIDEKAFQGCENLR